MSQASRSHARARARWRDQVARFIGKHQPVAGFDDWAFGGHFDVHAVRIAAERELARAEADIVEFGVFTDWTRERGLGPENRERGAFARLPLPGTFKLRHAWGKSEMLRRAVARGGWPGNLLREYASEGLGRADIVTAPARARVARRVLEALEGQPSECQNPRCESGRRTYSTGEGECSICRGTGHNLRGELPPVEVVAEDGLDLDAYATECGARRRAGESDEQLSQRLLDLVRPTLNRGALDGAVFFADER